MIDSHLSGEKSPSTLLTQVSGALSGVPERPWWRAVRSSCGEQQHAKTPLAKGQKNRPQKSTHG